MRRALLLGFVGLVACPPPTTDDTDPPVDPFDKYINTDQGPVGDLSCFTPGGGWNAQQVDAEKVATVDIPGTLLDFQEEEPVYDANVDVWFGDAISGAPDTSATTDDYGDFVVQSPVCQPVAYKSSTDPELGETQDTYEAHQFFEPDGADGALPSNFNSVSTTTYLLIPGVLGVTPDPSKSVIAGTAYGCDGEPVENAEVLVRDAAGNILDDVVIHYFQGRFPTRDQPHTSEDGLWVAIDVPIGVVTVEMYVLEGDAHVLYGATRLDSFENSINISNVYAGLGDGVRYPDACLVAE